MKLINRSTAILLLIVVATLLWTLVGDHILGLEGERKHANQLRSECEEITWRLQTAITAGKALPLTLEDIAQMPQVRHPLPAVSTIASKYQIFPAWAAAELQLGKSNVPMVFQNPQQYRHDSYGWVGFADRKDVSMVKPQAYTELLKQVTKPK